MDTQNAKQHNLQNIPCKICGAQSSLAFFAQILGRLNEPFYKCQHCGFLGCDEAHWLPQAYTSAINISDTGIVARNLYLYKIVSCVAAVLFAMNTKNGILTGGGGVKKAYLILVAEVGCSYGYFAMWG